MSRVDPHDTEGKCNTSSCEGVYFALGHIVPTWFSGTLAIRSLDW